MFLFFMQGVVIEECESGEVSVVLDQYNSISVILNSDNFFDRN